MEDFIYQRSATPHEFRVVMAEDKSNWLIIICYKEMLHMLLSMVKFGRCNTFCKLSTSIWGL